MFDLMPFSNRIDNVFDMFDRIFPTVPAAEKVPQLRAFRADIRKEDDHYLLEAELPGFEKEDISLDLSEGILTIRAERKSETEENDQSGHYVRKERYYGSLSRSFDVNGIDTEAITATYENGVLKLRLPKEQPALPEKRSIAIE